MTGGSGGLEEVIFLTKNPKFILNFFLEGGWG